VNLKESDRLVSFEAISEDDLERFAIEEGTTIPRPAAREEAFVRQSDGANGSDSEDEDDDSEDLEEEPEEELEDEDEDDVDEGDDETADEDEE
jgi:hypothetical protein